MANNEEISFVLNSNLDKIAKHAKVLSDNIDKLNNSFKRKNESLEKQNKLEDTSVEGVKKLSNNYSRLTDNISQIIKKNKGLAGSADKTESSLNKIEKSMSKVNKTFGSANKEDDNNIFKRFRKIGDFIHDMVKKIVDSVYSIGKTLASQALELKPFAFDFLSGFNLNPLQFFGFGNAMKEAFNLIKMFQQMKHEMAALSNEAGDASAAVGLIYEVAGKSAIASGTAQGVLKTLGDQGIITGKQLKSLGILSGNLQAATGIAASQWAGFTGELAFNYGVTSKGMEKITSALIGTNIRGAQLEKVMGTVNKVLQTTGYVAGVPTTESIHKLTKSIGGAAKTFQAMGISAEKAGGFIEGIMDPENFEKNAFLFGKLGISASEYAGYLNDADGQQKLLQKTMSNLPALASEISNIQNPFARIQFAKTIGLDMQIVQRMAGKTQAEIEQILADYEKENQGKEALEKKKQKMAAEAAKWDDMMLQLKMQVLGPVMKFLQGGYLNRLIKMLPKIAETVASIFDAIVPIVDEITNLMLEMIPIATKFIKKELLPIIRDIPKYIQEALSYLPGFDLGWKDIKKPGKNASAKEKQNYNRERAQNLFNVIKNVGEYLLKIYAALIAWKGGKFIWDGAKKVLGFLNPRLKTVSSASVGDLADEIGKSVNKHWTGGKRGKGGLGDFGGGKFGGMMRVLQRVATGLAAAYITYEVASEATKELGGTQTLSDRVGSTLGIKAFEKVTGEATIRYMKITFKSIKKRMFQIFESLGSKISGIFSFVKKIGVKIFESIGPKISKYLINPIKNFGSKLIDPIAKVGSKVFSPILKAGKAVTEPVMKAGGKVVSYVGSKLGMEGAGGTISKVFSKYFGKQALKTGLKSATSWKTLGAGLVGGLASESLAKNYISDKDPKKKEKVSAAKELGSTASSTAMALAMGGPAGAAINMAIEGAFKGFEQSEEINKLVKDSWKRPFLDAGTDQNMLDDIADKLQGGLGGAVTLGLGFMIDDAGTLMGIETKNWGKKMTGIIGEHLVTPLRTAARAYGLTADKYSALQVTHNLKFKRATEEFNKLVKEGKYIEALKTVGKMIGLKLKEYIVSPLLQFLESIKFYVLVSLASFQKMVTENVPGSETLWKQFLPDFGAMVDSAKEDARAWKAYNAAKRQITDDMSAKTAASILSYSRNLAQQRGLTSMTEDINEFLEELAKRDADRAAEAREKKKADQEMLKEAKKGNGIAGGILNEAKKGNEKKNPAIIGNINTEFISSITEYFYTT